ncbi:MULTISPECIES: hypothetical protein [unclassified Streptomyces]|uniref:hypothetical protein n=1 Tax=unclassified Streptomyces TaxID=2593676 RepID=UPI00036FFF5C|nr:MULTISPECIES: hypothetical protein [unclassified Streptomyces]MYT29416.1 hypothetical protein [Streptomyces sp. SID8354]
MVSSAPVTAPAPRRRGRAPALLASLVLALLPVLPPGPPAYAAAAADPPAAAVSQSQAGAGGSITVTGRGWRPHTLLTLLICGQNMIGGTNSCANGDGRTVTTDDRGAFATPLPVAEPPKPCPCVVHVAAVTGPAAAADAAFKVAGHPVAPLPQDVSAARLAVLAQPRLTGSSGLLTWFGAPPQRELVVTVGNLGSTPAKDPVFQVGTSHGVFAPQWDDQRWRGSVPAGRKAEVRLPVELAAGAHGDYLVSLKYGGRLLVEQPWEVGRPWGVTLFWLLLCIVVPAVVFRIGMAVVDRVRPPRPGAPDRARTAPDSTKTPRTPRTHRPSRSRRAHPDRQRRRRRDAYAYDNAYGDAYDKEPGTSTSTSTDTAPDGAAVLPWFTPDTAPSSTATERPPSKGS